MDYSAIFERLYNKIDSLPDFPKRQVEELRRFLPRCSSRIAALFYLLPFGENLNEEQIIRGEVLTLLTLSSFVHDDMTKGRAFSEKEAVLYGDYFFALAFSLLSPSLTKEEGHRIAFRACRYNEKRLEHRKAGSVTEEEILRFAKEDYGALLKDIAGEAMEKNDFEDDIKERYFLCAETLGTVWGLLCEGNASYCGPLLKQAEEEMDGLPMEAELTLLKNELEGAYLENKAQHRTAEK